MRNAALLLLIACGTVQAVHAKAAPATELVLAGGSLALCSSLSPRHCQDGSAPSGRTQSTYTLSDESIAAVRSLLEPGIGADGARQAAEELAVLRETSGNSALAAAAIEDALEALCRERDCRWLRLDDYQRAGLLAALEQPQRDGQGRRLRERVSLAASVERGGVAVIERFVAAARERAGGATPRIAFVTASGFDPFDAVDYYTSLFTEAGASAVWWPLDAAAAALVSAEGDCDTLGGLQQARLGLPSRERIYPDLVAMQREWCASERRQRLPAGVHGVFFAGGDQWRLRQAFFDAADAAYPWLGELRAEVGAGRVVVGGSSAGTAVQSGPGMLGNGTPAAALARGPEQAVPPTPGCARSGRCSASGEDAFTVWPAGGLGLSGPFLMDTHFSERAREWRMLRALAAGPARFGLGVDETSAVQLREDLEGWTLEAIGAAGAWLFEAGDRRCGQLQGRAHYLAPGRRLRWNAGEGLLWPMAEDEDLESRESKPMPALALQPPAGGGAAFARGAVRDAVPALALGLPAWSIDAEGASLGFEREPDSLVWTGEGNWPGLTGLRFTLRFTERCTH